MKKFLTIVIVLLLFSAILTSCGFEPAPKIKEGRFDFSITYEQWGETKTISGVYVCEYDGRFWTLEGGGFTREWSGHIEGVENLHDTYYATVHICDTDDGGEVLLSLGVFAAYFMGDPDFSDSVIKPGLFVAYSSEDNLTVTESNDDEEILELYGLRIVDYHYEKPVENTFGIFG